MEFLALISLLMIILAALHGVITSKQLDTYEERSTFDAHMVADDIGFELEMALVQGEGYSRIFTLPQNIGGSNYSIDVSGGNILLEYRDEQVMSSTRYPNELSLEVNSSQNIFEVKNNESGVYIVEK